MALLPDIHELMGRARADLRMGLPVVFRVGAQRFLAVAIEAVSAERLGDIHGLNAGAEAVLSDRRAETLKLAAYDGDLVRIAVPQSARLDWLRALANPASDLSTPLKGPFSPTRGGDVTAHRAALYMVKDSQLLPAALVAPAPNADFAKTNLLTELPAAETLALRAAPQVMAPVSDARLPLSVSEAGRVHVFRPAHGGEEHYAVEIGRPDRNEPVLARLHSACFTGDILGSLKCDCGPQLRGALAQMGSEGAGVLLYLNQEGRGIGLANKMRAYALQNQGFDTVDANHRLGFEDDERDFRLGADLLRQMGFSKVRLLTNNPNKIAMLEKCGLTVTERVPLKVGETPQNAHYLATKAKRSGHML